MPKTPKNQRASGENSAASNGIATSSEAAPAPATKRAKSAKAPAAKKSATKKKSTSAAAGKSRPKRTPQPAESGEPSEADIRLRAYFIAERRVQLALHGDPAKDWLEARQQLIEEARQGQS